MPISDLEFHLLRKWGASGYGQGYDYRNDPIRSRAVDVASREWREKNPTALINSKEHKAFVEKRAMELDKAAREPPADKSEVDRGDPARRPYGNPELYPQRIGYGNNQVDSQPGRKVYGDETKFPRRRDQKPDTLTFAGHERQKASALTGKSQQDYYGNPKNYPAITKMTPGRQK